MARATGVPINRIGRESFSCFPFYLQSTVHSRAVRSHLKFALSLSLFSLFNFNFHRVHMSECVWLCVRESSDSISDEWTLKWTSTNCCVNKVKPFHPVNSLWTSRSFWKATREALYHLCSFPPSSWNICTALLQPRGGREDWGERESADCFFFSPSLSSCSLLLGVCY